MITAALAAATGPRCGGPERLHGAIPTLRNLTRHTGRPAPPSRVDPRGAVGGYTLSIERENGRH